MRFQRGNLIVEVNEEIGTIVISRDDGYAAPVLGADEVAWLMWGPLSAGLQALRVGRPATDAPEQLTMEDAGVIVPSVPE